MKAEFVRIQAELGARLSFREAALVIDLFLPCGVRNHMTAHRRLREGLDCSVFRGLDFDKLAKSKRTMGHRPKL